MDSLPQEIIDKIASYIPEYLDWNGEWGNSRQSEWENERQSEQSDQSQWENDQHSDQSEQSQWENDRQRVRVWPGLATLSRTWQAAIEKVTFERLTIASTDFSEFSTAFSTVHRRRLLQSLYFTVILPPYSVEADQYESNQDRERNNEVAGQEVNRLLRELATWPTDSTIELHIWFKSPTDEVSTLWGRHAYSYIRLTGLDQLQVPCVSSLTPRLGLWRGDRIIHPRSLVSLTATFPRVSEISFEYDEPGPFFALRRELRGDFVASLEGFKLPSQVKRLRVGAIPPRLPHNKSLPDMIGPVPSDPLCVTVNKMVSQSNVREVYYEGLVDPSFFRTSPDGFYSSLRILRLRCHYYSPSGKWYFKGSESNTFIQPASDEPLPASTRGLYPPGYGTEDDTVAALAYERSMDRAAEENTPDDRSQQFRLIPNEEIMVPLLEAFARYIASIRSLQQAQIIMDRPPWLGEWKVTYNAPGYPYFYDTDREDLSRARVYFLVWDWEPEDSLVDLFRAIGQELYEQDAVITFMPSSS
ncbi:hypothetical protein M434DRAFT_33236 [Hypoxylon sp. CO27-5]|nr:hypothetical protein M434DRAFT_33236 [Hypoxylon sp. CO27-5]